MIGICVGAFYIPRGDFGKGKINYYAYSAVPL